MFVKKVSGDVLVASEARLRLVARARPHRDQAAGVSAVWRKAFARILANSINLGLRFRDPRIGDRDELKDVRSDLGSPRPLRRSACDSAGPPCAPTG